jgi:hypothetical protein
MRYAEFVKASRQIAARPECVVAIFLLGTIAVSAVDAYIIDGKPLMEALAKVWLVIATLMAKPLIQLLMVPLAIWLFARGVQQVIAANNDVQARETAIRSEAVTKANSMVNFLIEHYANVRHFDANRAIVQRFDIEITSARKAQENLRNGPEFAIRFDEWRRAWTDYAQNLAPLAGRASQAVRGVDSEITLRNSPHATMRPGLASNPHFRPQDNQKFFEDWSHDLATLQNLSAALGRELDLKEVALIDDLKRIKNGVP